MEKECECYEEEVQPYRKTDYKPIIYNDFSRASDLFFSIIYADDTSVFIEGTHLEQMLHIINEELQQIDTWLKANKLTINLKKHIT